MSQSASKRSKRPAKPAITKESIPDYAPATVALPNGWTAKVRTERDEHMGAPWEEHDGHGPVSEWRSYRDFSEYDKKAAGERMLCQDRSSARYYDFAEAVKIAKRDGWGCSHYDNNHKSNGVIAACAAEQDFERMRAWCEDEWYWIGVIVELYDASGERVDESSVWGIESDTDYWREVAAELINELAGGVVLPNFAADTDAAVRS